MSNQTDNINSGPDIKEIIKKAFDHKFLFIAFFIFSFSLAFFINRFASPTFEVNALIGPIENGRSGLLGSNELFSGMEAYSQARNLQDDINSVKSFSLVSSTIKKLSLEIGYFVETNNILAPKKQTYSNTPYIINIDKSHLQPINVKFYIQPLDGNSYRLTSEIDNVQLYNFIDNEVVGSKSQFKIDTICKFYETISNSNFKFSVTPKTHFLTSGETDSNNYFEFYHLDKLTKQYLKNISADPVNPRSSLIKIRFKGKNRELTVEFLNKYIETFLDENLTKKNQIAVNTIQFIDSQISEISDSLLASESMLRDYRSANQVTDLSYQGQQALTQLSSIEAQMSSLQVQERYYNYILDYFNKNQDIAGIAPPSAANVIDPIMNTLILELLETNGERSAILSNNAEKNLFLGQIENRIELQKNTIIENVKNNLNTLELTKSELNYRKEKITTEISRLPRTELNMVSIQRKFDLTDALYTYLLQKRSEAAITMSSNYPDYELIDPARMVNMTILTPKIRMNWLLAFFLSILIPSFYVFLKTYLNNRITSVRELEHLANKKVLNTIYKNTYNTENVVVDFVESSVTESFRNLRSSLFVRFRNTPLKVILVTSSQPQDGKSFISYNLATSIAKVGHKSIILDGDLRRPTLHSKFKIENKIGLSTYMAGKLKKEDIFFRSVSDNLDFIPAGPVMPNISELIEAGALDSLMDWLQENYNYVIIDTNPAGVISDSIQLAKYASVILLVARNDSTNKDDFRDVIKLFENNNIDNYEIVYNGVDPKHGRYGKYRNYYTTDKKKSFRMQI